MSDGKGVSSLKRAKGFLTISAVRDVLLVSVIAVVVWKLAGATFVIDMDKFGFVELLATLMAFFAIGLSVAFYFKATETSNTFYDNVYHFTKGSVPTVVEIENGVISGCYQAPRPERAVNGGLRHEQAYHA